MGKQLMTNIYTKSIWNLKHEYNIKLHSSVEMWFVVSFIDWMMLLFSGFCLILYLENMTYTYEWNIFLYIIIFDLYWCSAADETPSCANIPAIYGKAMYIDSV